MQIGIPEEVVAKGSMLVYMLPLITMLGVMSLAHWQFAHEVITTVSALLGLCIGGLIVRWYSHLIRFDRRLQPVLVDETHALNFYSSQGQH